MTGPVRVRKEMGVSHQEILRIVPRLAPAGETTVTGNRVVIEADGRRVEITLEEEGSRSLGIVQLPVTWVELAFYGHSEAQVKAFLEQFEQRFQRAGG